MPAEGGPPGRGSRVDIADEARLTEIRVELDDLEQGTHGHAGNAGLEVRVHRAIHAAARNELLEATLDQYANLARS